MEACANRSTSRASSQTRTRKAVELPVDWLIAAAGQIYVHGCCERTGVYVVSEHAGHTLAGGRRHRRGCPTATGTCARHPRAVHAVQVSLTNIIKNARRHVWWYSASPWQPKASTHTHTVHLSLKRVTLFRPRAPHEAEEPKDAHEAVDKNRVPLKERNRNSKFAQNTMAGSTTPFSIARMLSARGTGLVFPVLFTGAPASQRGRSGPQHWLSMNDDVASSLAQVLSNRHRTTSYQPVDDSVTSNVEASSFTYNIR